MSDIVIPTPIAPVRPPLPPNLGNGTTPANYNGAQGYIDANGKFTAVNGQSTQIGKPSNSSSNSLWDIFDDPMSVIANNAALTPIGDAVSTAVGSAGITVADAANEATRTIFGFSVMDAVFIVLGLIAIIGALYTFEGTRDVIKTATKVAAAAA